ncbi:MAG: hypothetical protein HOM14_10230 [Gammaproteobacteria bacterium]|jgi:hypothetical protein|nr:hypothetical protein [Gammaproteobacteria bacterium]MBT4196845.1 hypothetical protein [Gammaproteobacteria bacterium]MBT4450019.1 hypothetical protein [Gammaproteobacteria bacterium]MBT4861903.1 hypothetical protein [Gammaproteobacteria bacterium]MBT6551719.1 hypothetical protein [Gammaproteobacteria bacterium]
MPIKEIIQQKTHPVKIWTDEIENATREQLLNVASLPFIHHHVAAMPDVHLGMGATIGSVIATHRAIIPAAVGVDLGCGMIASRLSLKVEDLNEALLKKLFDQISRDIPVGKAQHRDDQVDKITVQPFIAPLGSLTERHPELLKRFGKKSKWINQMDTLGSGNHFIELCFDEEDYISSMERGLKSPTLEKIDEISREMGLHPLTLLVITYSGMDKSKSSKSLLNKIKKELEDLAIQKKASVYPSLKFSLNIVVVKIISDFFKKIEYFTYWFIHRLKLSEYFTGS